MQALQATIQHNCHISDAQFAGNYTLCIYLLKMREYYRWEKHLPFGNPLSNDDIGQWLTEREGLWESVEEHAYSPVEINGVQVDPFETREMNALLNKHSLVYSGGYGQYGKPVFFLAELHHKQQQDDFTLYVSGRELARDLAAPPGMSQDKCVFIRRESLRRFIWEKFEESHWYKDENPLKRALACYDFANHLEDSLNQMTDHEVHTVLLHEIGEIKAGQLLGEEWEQMLVNLPRSKGEFMARAVRDHLADALSTLPELLKTASAAQIHFYFANLGSMRKMIYPGLMNAYHEWLHNQDVSPLKKLVNKSQAHWLKLAKAMMELHHKFGTQSHVHMEALIKENYL